MSLTRQIAHNTTIQIVGKVVSTFLGLIAIALLTRYLGAEQFGWYVTASSYLQFIGILIDFGFTVTISNLLAEPAFDKTKLLNTTFTWRFFSALVFYLIAPLVILLFPYGREIKIGVAVLSLSFFCTALNQVFVGYYRTKLQLFIVSISEVTGRIVLVVGIWLLVNQQQGFLPLVGVVTIASLATTIYLWWPLRTIRFSFDKEISIALFYKIWPTAISVIFNTLYLQADRVIMPLYRSQSEVGLYGAAYRVLDIVTQIEAIVMGMLMPLITYAWSMKLLDEFKKRYQLGFDLLALLLFPMIAGIFVLANPIMQLITGPNFGNSGIMLKYLSFSIFGTCFGMIFGHIILAINRQKQALYVYASDAIISLAGYFIFIPKYGWLGAVGVTVFSEIYAGFWLAVLCIHYTKIVPKLFTLTKIIVASFLMGALVHFAQPLALIPSILLGLITYIILVLGLKIIKKETIREVLSLSHVAVNTEI